MATHTLQTLKDTRWVLATRIFETGAIISLDATIRDLLFKYSESERDGPLLEFRTVLLYKNSLSAEDIFLYVWNQHIVPSLVDSLPGTRLFVPSISYRLETPFAATQSAADLVRYGYDAHGYGDPVDLPETSVEPWNWQRGTISMGWMVDCNWIQQASSSSPSRMKAGFNQLNVMQPGVPLALLLQFSDTLSAAMAQSSHYSAYPFSCDIADGDELWTDQQTQLLAVDRELELQRLDGAEGHYSKQESEEEEPLGADCGLQAAGLHDASGGHAAVTSPGPHTADAHGVPVSNPITFNGEVIDAIDYGDGYGEWNMGPEGRTSIMGEMQSYYDMADGMWEEQEEILAEQHEAMASGWQQQQEAEDPAAASPHEVSAADMNVWEFALSGGPAEEKLLEHACGIDITRRLIQCMRSGEWLNDDTVNVYMAMLQGRDTVMHETMPGRYPKAHFYNSFFVCKLYKDEEKYSYEKVRGWTAPDKLRRWGQASDCILDVDRLVVPVHQLMHWAVAVIDLHTKRVIYYDSLRGRDDELLQNLIKYICDEYKDKRQEEVDPASWTAHYSKDCPRQLNGYDCGVFAIKAADYAAMGKAWDYTQQDIDNIRVNTVVEIVAGEVGVPVE